MYICGQLLELKKDNIELAEIISILPSGQLGMKKTHYEIILCGEKIKLSETALNNLFSVYIHQETKQVEKKDDKPVTKTIKTTKTTKTKKTTKKGAKSGKS